jgi:hypothetical protein
VKKLLRAHKISLKEVAMNLKFKSTHIAIALACAFSLASFEGTLLAQESTATIKLSSSGSKDEEVLPVLETQPSIAPEPDANTMPLLRLATRGAMGGLDDGARPAVFTANGEGDPNYGFAGRAGFAIQDGPMPVQQGTLISPAPFTAVAADGNHQLRSKDRTNVRSLTDEYIYDGADR